MMYDALILFIVFALSFFSSYRLPIEHLSVNTASLWAGRPPSYLSRQSETGSTIHIVRRLASSQNKTSARKYLLNNSTDGFERITHDEIKQRPLFMSSVHIGLHGSYIINQGELGGSERGNERKPVTHSFIAMPHTSSYKDKSVTTTLLQLWTPLVLWDINHEFCSQASQVDASGAGLARASSLVSAVRWAKARSRLPRQRSLMK